jgi:hypothetical protein
VAERGDQGELAGLGGVDRDRAGAVEDFRAAALPMVEQGGGVEDAVLRLAQETGHRDPAQHHRRGRGGVGGIEAMVGE